MDEHRTLTNGGPFAYIAAQILPLGASSFMHVIGGVEMLVGGLILVGYTRLGGYAAAVWLVGIAAMVTTEHHFDVAMRDVIIAIAAFTLARIIEVRASDQVRDGVGGLSLLGSEKMIA